MWAGSPQPGLPIHTYITQHSSYLPTPCPPHAHCAALPTGSFTTVWWTCCLVFRPHLPLVGWVLTTFHHTCLFWFCIVPTPYLPTSLCPFTTLDYHLPRMPTPAHTTCRDCYAVLPHARCVPSGPFPATPAPTTPALTVGVVTR